MWQQTMYCQFGQIWCKLHHGPLWIAASSSHTVMAIESVSHYDYFNIDQYPVLHTYTSIQALVDIPALSEQTIRRDLEASKVTVTSEIQVTS